MKTKTKTNTRSRNRLQSLGSAELARVTGGETMCQLAGKYADDTGWHEFFYAAGNCQPYYLCFPG